MAIDRILRGNMKNLSYLDPSFLLCKVLLIKNSTVYL